MRYAISGFTLSELLVAIAVLGIVAIFAIPKLIQGSMDSKRVTTFKETISIVERILYEGKLSGELVDNGNVREYFLSRINAAKTCWNNSYTEGCWPQNTPAQIVQAGEPGVVLAGGAAITGFNSYGPPSEPDSCFWGGNNLVIDWNGPEPPNIIGDDQMRLVIWTCQGTSNAVANAKIGTTHFNWSSFGPQFTTSETLYREIMK